MVAFSRSSSTPLLDPAAALRAESLWSTLAGGGSVPLTAREARFWIERWRRSARSYGADLDQRLNCAGWSRGSVLRALMLEGAPTPAREWISALQEWIRLSLTRSRSAEAAPTHQQGRPKAEKALPFEELLKPLAAHLVEGLPSLGSQGGRPLESLLVRLLSDLAAPGLQSEFARRSGEFRGYADFVGQPATVWRGLFSRRPVLGRLMVESSQRWKSAMDELLERLDRDRPRLRSCFNDGRSLGPLQSLRKAGDEHLGGRAVYVLRFESGLRLVYKPRDLSPEAAWLRLLRWLNRRRRLDPFPEVATLCRDGYGWMEHVAHEPIPNAAAAQRYYRSAGTLIGLVYALGGRDFHFENLIVSGGRPVPIDLETVLQPVFREEVLGGDDNFPRGTVLETGLLPSWSRLLRRRPADLSGLGCIEPQTTSFWKLKFSQVNSDAMKLRRTAWRIEPFANVPRTGRQVFPPGEFPDAVCHGFQSAYREIRALRSGLLSRRGPLQGFRDLTIRVLLRNSVSYWDTLQRSLHLVCLAHGIRRSLSIDPIAAKWIDGDGPPFLWPAAEAEIQALERLDVPVFHAAAESRDLLLPSGDVLPRCFRLSPFENAETRLGQMSDGDMKAQLRFIESSLRRHRMAQREGRRLGPLLAWMLQKQEAEAPRR